MCGRCFAAGAVICAVFVIQLLNALFSNFIRTVSVIIVASTAFVQQQIETVINILKISWLSVDYHSDHGS